MDDPAVHQELITGDGTRDWARFDTSDVPHQGGYVAKQCPVRAQNDFLQPVEPLALSAGVQRRIHAGIRFEQQIRAAVAAEVDLADIPHRADREKATIAAMRDGATLIYGGRLPTDHDGRRVGEPDFLVKETGSGGKWSYRPIDIKHHLTLREDEKGGAVVGDLVDASLAGASETGGESYRRHKGDLMQLAHYQRMLESCGWAATDRRWGGIIGKEQRVVWTDLDDKIWRTPAVTKKTKMRSTIHVYDFEFAFRLDILAAAIKYNAGHSQDLLVVPVRNSECPECPWKGYCDSSLEAGAGDISLIPGLGFNQWKVHRDTTGFLQRDKLARLDWATADLLAARIDVASLLSDADGLAPETPISDLKLTKRRHELLTERGFETAGDLSALSEVTAQYSGKPAGSLAKHIDLARAALADGPAYRLREVDAVQVPRADVELDIDMENTDDGAFMWGVLLCDRTGSGFFEEGYRAFVTWNNAVESFMQTFGEFWEWLIQMRKRAEKRGLTLVAYCYHAMAENTQMLGLAGEREPQVREFLDSEQWIDLLAVMRAQLVTGDSLSLKKVAPLAGFEWAVDDPSGDEAMVKYDLASSEGEEAEPARRWLLEYNRGDVEATLAVREWLSTTAFGSLADLDNPWAPESGRA